MIKYVLKVTDLWIKFLAYLCRSLEEDNEYRREAKEKMKKLEENVNQIKQYKERYVRQTEKTSQA